MKCYIEHKAYQKMQYYIQNIDAEISGLGKTRVDGDDIYVEDLCIFKQNVTGSRTELDYDERARFSFELKKKGEKQENWNLWWHSHNTMGVFWSKTDDTAVENEMGKIPYLLSIVGNKKKELLTRIDITLEGKTPFSVGTHFTTIDKVETIIMPAIVSHEEMETYNDLATQIEFKKAEFETAKIQLDSLNEQMTSFLELVEEDKDLEEELIKEIKTKVTNSSYIPPTTSYNKGWNKNLQIGFEDMEDEDWDTGRYIKGSYEKSDDLVYARYAEEDSDEEANDDLELMMSYIRDKTGDLEDGEEAIEGETIDDTLDNFIKKLG